MSFMPQDDLNFSGFISKIKAEPNITLESVPLLATTASAL